ncbi:MAG: ATP-binding protein [Campylobacterota bacterium]|nr:ATP-binding protein [Campylobacterota bacterium]
MSKYNDAVMIAKNVYWVGELMDNDAFQCHAYLIVDAKESILIDSGSMFEYESIKRKVESIIPLKNIKYIIAHHQDPDVCANTPAFEKEIDRDDLLIVSHSRNIALIKHYAIKSNYYIIEKNNFKLKTKNLSLEFITTPYSHAPGAFTTYLNNTKTLFSSDIFGAVEESWHFYANENYFNEIKLFHENYMPSQDILNYSLNKIQSLDLELIAPQHGSLIKKEYIDLIIDELKELKCGVYIEDAYKESLLYKNKLLKEKEQQEQKNAKKLELIMDLQEDIITIITDGQNLKYINKAFFKFTNFKNIQDFKQNHNCICELFLDSDNEKYIKSTYKENENYNWINHLLENQNQELYAIMKNSINIDTLFKVDIKKFTFDENEKDEYLVTFHDITEYIESLDFLDIISNIDDLYFCITNYKWELLKISDSLAKILKLENFNKEEHLLSDFFNTKDIKLINQHISNNDSSPFEIKLRYNDKKIPIMAQEYFGNINQKPVVVSIFRDLRSIKAIEKESNKKDLILFQQSKMIQMGDMVNMIAHQWRQPLNAISASSSKILLEKELNILSDDEFINSNYFIQSQCQKMSKVINTFLNYSNPSKEMTEFKIIDMINDILELVETQFNNHNIKIIVEDKNKIAISVNGYCNMLEQVIINLLMNARDAYSEIDSTNNKQIYITIHTNKTITITDYAGGITQENQEKLFTPYFTTKEQGKGTGLGLYMSKRIINEQFNGDLIYKSIDGGSIFEIICGYK